MQRGDVWLVSLDPTAVRVIRGDQPHVLDLVTRHGGRPESIPEPTMNEVLARLAAILA